MATEGNTDDRKDWSQLAKALAELRKADSKIKVVLLMYDNNELAAFSDCEGYSPENRLGSFSFCVSFPPGTHCPPDPPGG